MNFTQLENLDAVLEYGGVRRAAAHLGVTPQAVSSSIRKLERELGCALFERVGIELRPTGFCLRFANQAKSVLIAEFPAHGLFSGLLFCRFRRVLYACFTEKWI